MIGVFTLGPVAFQCKKLIKAKLDIYIHCNKIFNEAIQTFDQTDSILFVKSNQLKTVPNATENLEKHGFLTLIILKNINFIALVMKRASKWYIFHQILIILKIPVIFHVKTSNGTALL